MPAKTEDTHIKPTEAEVPILTDRLAEIEAEIDELKTEAKGIRARLELFALDQKGEPLADAKREGRKVTLAGRRYALPVIFTSDLLIGSFKNGSPKHQELREILKPVATGGNDEGADRLIRLFFDPPATWEARMDDGQKFRAAAAEWLPESVAPKFIAACTQRDKHGVKKSNTVFDFKAVKQIGKEVV